ncbi:hypothetical protein FXO38_11248, partial [Capsicum annuum]
MSKVVVSRIGRNEGVKRDDVSLRHFVEQDICILDRPTSSVHGENVIEYITRFGSGRYGSEYEGMKLACFGYYVNGGALVEEKCNYGSGLVQWWHK